MIEFSKRTGVLNSIILRLKTLHYFNLMYFQISFIKEFDQKIEKKS